MLLDMQMPKKNGIQVVEEVKAMYKNAQESLRERGVELVEPLYVFLTAFSSIALRKHLVNLGVTHIYEKPIS